jgi:hypothetical protein
MNALVVHHVADIERMARALASSKLFGVQNAEQALALCLVAQAEGRHPATAAQDYHILQGRPAKKADAMLRDFLAGGGKVQWHRLDDGVADATFTHPAGGSARIDWTLERARKAGLNTPMWSKYPRQMLRARCVSEGVRTVFPMATSGMYVPEEVQDIVAEEARPAPPQAAHEPIQSALPAPAGLKRLTSARAKEIGLDKQLKDAIWGTTDPSELAEWDAEFDKHTAQCPLSWLDSIKNEVILRAEAFANEAQLDEAEAMMTDAFKGAIGPAVAA